MRGALLCALTLCVAIAACKTRHIAGRDLRPAGNQLDVHFELPLGVVDPAVFCSGAKSIEVHLDTTAAGTGPIASTILFDTDGNLQGCGAAVCNSAVDLQLTQLGRVVVEWTDDTTQEYLMGKKADVVCRGVARANGATGFDDITQLGSAGDFHFSANVPLLRVGDMNPLFTTTGEILTIGAAASGFDSADSTARSETGGKIAVGGGQGMSTWIFDPRTISGTSGPPLAHQRYALTASDLHSAGHDYVLFAGGSSSNVATADADLLEAGGNIEQNLPLSHPRADHGAFAAPQGKLDTTMLVGGCDDTGMNSQVVVEVFFLSIPAGGLGGASCSAPAGLRGSCPAPNGLAAGACAATLARFDDDHGVFLGGYNSTAGFLQKDYDISIPGNLGTVTFTPRPTPTPPGNRHATVAVLGSAAALEIGGNPDLANVLSGMQQVRRIDVSGTSTLAAPLLRARTKAAAVTLLDSNVLVTGGATAISDLPAPIELLVAASNFAPTYVTPPGAVCDAGGTGTGCVSLVTPRRAHTATRINGTTSWLNGAVLIAGKGPSELFVPAYVCNAANEPIGAGGVTIGRADYCDRGVTPRAVLQPTN